MLVLHFPAWILERIQFLREVLTRQRGALSEAPRVHGHFLLEK